MNQEILKDIVQGYVLMMFDKWDEVGQEVKEAAQKELSALISTVSAEQARSYYLSAPPVK